MTLPTHISDREFQKFVEDADGKVAVRQAPNVIKSSSGNEMEVDDINRARAYDDAVHSALIAMIAKLESIEFQLKLITGA